MMWKELWDSVEGLSDLIRKANWGIAIALALTLFCTVVVIVADKRRERLTRSADQVKERCFGCETQTNGSRNTISRSEKEAGTA